MSAAAPTEATPLPANLADAQRRLSAMKIDQLRGIAAAAKVDDTSWKKHDYIANLAPKFSTLQWDAEPIAKAALAAVPDAEPVASTGNIDANGDVIGAAPTLPVATDASVIGAAPADPYDCDSDGFPADSSNVEKLDNEHLDALVFWLTQNVVAAPANGLAGDERVAWIVQHGYEQEAEEKAPHIPTASPAPTTVTTDELARINAEGNADPTPAACACAGKGGYETDTGWEPCTKCDGAIESDGQLTLVPGGDAPVKSILNVAALRYDLGSSTEFKDGDIVTVSFDVVVDKIAFIPEKAGGESKRRVRTHAGAIDQESVSVTLAN